jgi:hypothetical protein
MIEIALAFHPPSYVADILTADSALPMLWYVAAPAPTKLGSGLIKK